MNASFMLPLFLLRLMAACAAIITIGALPSHAQGGTLQGSSLQGSSWQGSSWQGSSWFESPAQLPGMITCMSVMPNGMLIAGTLDSGVYISTDRGVTFTQVNNGLPDRSIYGMCIARGNQVVVGTATAGVYGLQLDQLGATWKVILPNVKVDAVATFNGTIVYVSGFVSSQGPSLWLLDFSGRFPTSQTVYTGEQLWTLTAGDSGYAYGGTPQGKLIEYSERAGGYRTLPFTVRAVQSMAVSRKGTLLASTSSIYRSTDRGTTWDSTVGPASTPTLLAVPDGMLFAATDLGVHASGDDGITWESLDRNGIPGTRVYSLAVGPQRTLYAGTMAGRIYRLDYTNSVTGIDRDHVESYPADAGTGTTVAAIPNVAREAMTLRYSTAQREDVHITITSIDGRNVATYHQQHDAGTHTLNVPVDAFASGLYMVRLTAGSHVATTSVMVLH